MATSQVKTLRKSPYASQKKTPRPGTLSGSLTASGADRHVLYEISVQDPDSDITFIDRVYKKARGCLPRVLREDFCGTAALCAAWVKRGAERQAIGVDLHQPTMDWGAKHHLAKLGEARSRVRLLRRNVMDGIDAKADVTVAFNFSYCALHARNDMKRYFARVLHDTDPKGAFLLDMHGGTECFEEMEETTRHRGFTYVWDQGPYDPISGLATRRIHFRFPDGSQKRNAFTYPWRMWTLPELRDILLDAGFAQVDVYWEGSDAKGEGNGIFRKTKKAQNEASWIAYIVAWRHAALT